MNTEDLDDEIEKIKDNHNKLKEWTTNEISMLKTEMSNAKFFFAGIGTATGAFIAYIIDEFIRHD